MKGLLRAVADALSFSLGMTISLLCVAWSDIATAVLIAVLLVWYGYYQNGCAKVIAQIRGFTIWHTERFGRLKGLLIRRRKTDGNDSTEHS